MLRRLFVVLWLAWAAWAAGWCIGVAVMLYQENARQADRFSMAPSAVARRIEALGEAAVLLAVLTAPPGLLLAGLQFVLIGHANPRRLLHPRA